MLGWCNFQKNLSLSREYAGLREDFNAGTAAVEALRRLEAAELDPGSVWAWTMRFDGVTLAELCASTLTHDEVAEHLHERTGLVGGVSWAA